MPKSPTSKARLAPEAETDLVDILEWSDTRFGEDAAIRYAELIIQALRDIEADPLRPNARHLTELQPGLLSYHLANSRDRVIGARVKTPRHFILYRHLDDRLDVVRILHDSRDIAQHLPDE